MNSTEEEILAVQPTKVVGDDVGMVGLLEYGNFAYKTLLDPRVVRHTTAERL